MLDRTLKKVAVAQQLAVAHDRGCSVNNSVAYYFYGYWFSQRRAWYLYRRASFTGSPTTVWDKPRLASHPGFFVFRF